MASDSSAAWVALVLTVTAFAASAEESTPGRVIEEIVVTAQKREQSLQEVPISISVLGDEFIAEHGIVDLSTASVFLPNVQVTSNGFLADARIRGFGTIEVNKGFEQAVGMNVDGVLYGLKPYIQQPLFDAERIEVLRGPQGTLFAKNNTAGLFNVVTNDPTAEFTGSIAVELGELDRRRFEGAVGGPLVKDLVEFRAAGLSDERDGFLRNTSAAFYPDALDREGGYDRNGVRMKLGFPDVAGADVVVSYERIQNDITGIGGEAASVNPKMLSFYRSFDPTFDPTPENFVNSYGTRDFYERDGDTVVADASLNLAGWTIDGIAGWALLRVFDQNDADNSPAPTAMVRSGEDNMQTTFELRATSPLLAGLPGLGEIADVPLGSTDVTMGFFWQRREVDDSDFHLRLNEAATAITAAYSNAPQPLPPNPALAGETFADRNETSSLFWEQTSDAIAGFGQVNWRFLPRWTALGGLRIGRESKSASWRRICTEGSCALHRAALNAIDFTEHLADSEFEASPKLGMGFDWTDEITSYASWTKGHRAFGYNEFAFNPDPRFLTYDSEETTAWEVGTKSKFLGGTARANVALFWMEVSDFQNFTTDPNATASGAALSSSLIVNAGELRARGVEVDLEWLPADWLTVFGSMGFNDTRYLDFVLGSCARDRVNADGDAFPQCDLTGRPLDRAPEWTANVIPSIRLPLPGLADVDLLGSLHVRYQDVSYVNPNLDPRHKQPSYVRVAANVGFGNEAQGWSLELVGENLNDVDTIVRTSDVASTNPAVIFTWPETPRLFYGRLRWRF